MIAFVVIAIVFFILGRFTAKYKLSIVVTDEPTTAPAPTVTPPAVHSTDADKWWKNGRFHRVDGPAVDEPDVSVSPATPQPPTDPCHTDPCHTDPCHTDITNVGDYELYSKILDVYTSHKDADFGWRSFVPADIVAEYKRRGLTGKHHGQYCSVGNSGMHMPDLSL